MDNHDTVPIGAAIAIFVALGILIVAAFAFAIWSAFSLRNATSGTVLALGKTIEFVQAAEIPEIPYEYDVPTLLVEFFGIERHVGLDGEYEVIQAPSSGGFFGEDVYELIGGELFIQAKFMNFIFYSLGYAEPWDEEDEPVSAIAILEDLGYGASFDATRSLLSVFAPEPEPEPEPEPTPTPVQAAPAAIPQAAATPPPPAPEPVQVTCSPCGGTGTMLCTACNGIGGGRAMLLEPGIPHEFAESGLQWWCTVCMAQTRMTCATCSGSGTVLQ